MQRFSDRIQALAASHDLLAKSQWQSIAVSAARSRSARALRRSSGAEGYVLDGPPLDLSVAGAQCIGMVVHELATNAAKHGALSNQDGRVEIAWQVKSDTADERFTISWIERGGPPVAGPHSSRLRLDRHQEHGRAEPRRRGSARLRAIRADLAARMPSHKDIGRGTGGILTDCCYLIRRVNMNTARPCGRG